MKTIKALKNYVCAPYSRSKGETADVPNSVAARLVMMGFAEYVEEAAVPPSAAPKPAGGKSSASTRKGATRKRVAAKK